MRQESNIKCSADVIIAALNEEEGIGPTLTEISQKISPNQILVVDGHSHDRTVEIAKDLGAHILFQDGLGKGDAISKAVGYIDSDVDYVVVTDADFTYPAQHIPEMIQILENHPNVGMVCGNRFSGYSDIKGLNGFFYLGNRLIGFTQNFLNGVWLADPLTGLRVLRAEILRHWKVKSKGFDVEVELNHHVKLEGFGIAEIPIKYRERLGDKKLGVRHGVEIFRRIMLEATH